MRKMSVLAAVLVLFLAVTTSVIAGEAQPPYTPCLGNLIVNGDFESGDYYFETDYSNTRSMYDPRAYRIGTNPHDWHSAWATFGDHTSGSGLMMIVNATCPTGGGAGCDESATPPYDDIVWQQTVTVSPNTVYDFSYWVALSYPQNPPLLQVSVNGTPIGTYDAVSNGETAKWKQVKYQWFSGADTSAEIKLVDQRPVYQGDDYTLDDFELCCYASLKDETGWAAGPRYTTRGNWATYVAYSGEAKSVTLFAGQTMEAGTVDFSAASGGSVTITITLNPGWRFKDVPENVKIQDYASTPSGNPSPGLFTSKGYATGSPFSIPVPQNIYYGVHVDLMKEIPCVPAQ